MNDVISQLKNRKSVRSFSNGSVSEEHLIEIFEAAQQAPTSINAQQITLVYTRDKEIIKKIADLAGGQTQVASADVFVTIVIDFNRTKIASKLGGKEQVIHATAEGLVVGAGDAGIMLNALQTAANSLGYGSTAIGGIRNNPNAMIELLKLPKMTYPIFGITLGVPSADNNSNVKPRVPLKSFALEGIYNSDLVEEGVKLYDITLRQWWDDQNLFDMRSYTEETAMFYSQVYFPKVAETLSRQGFDFKDE
ncbi:TPA: nitroreductase family protein [Vibrio alginolyticus]